MSVKNDIERYLFHPKVRETYDLFNSIDKGDGYPNMNYIGINFNSKAISSFKFYFSFFRKLSKKDILKFLPDADDFLKYYYLWDESKIRSLEHSGCTFEVKFKPDMIPIVGFHFRLRNCEEAYNLIGKPALLPFDVQKINTRPGISYEYWPNATLRKIYYYLDTTESREYISKRFNLPFAEKSLLVEYTESEQFSKVILWRFDYTPENLNRPNVFAPYACNVMQYLKDKYGLQNIVDGVYEHSDIRASYYFNVLNNTSESPFEEEVNINSIDTLKLFFDTP